LHGPRAGLVLSDGYFWADGLAAVLQRFLAASDRNETRGLITCPGGGGAGGINGDHILLAPPFVITREQIDDMVGILREAIAAGEKHEK
jgi:adenosylmethionine-8-amino-7-oxononanoate aminotransferase